MKKSIEETLSYTKGLNPNSKEMRAYLNSSRSKDGWKYISEEIADFAGIIEDTERHDYERVDAKGYYAICKFKILGYLHGLLNKEIGSFSNEVEKLSPILKQHFHLEDKQLSLSDKELYGLLLEHTETYAKEVVAQHEDKNTAWDSSAAGQACAVLIQLSRIGGTEHPEYGETHFKMMQQSAELGNSRSLQGLALAYKWLSTIPPYKEYLGNRIKKWDIELEQFDNHCAKQRKACLEKAVELKNYDACANLAEIYKQEGNLQLAESTLLLGAHYGSAEAQFELAVFYQNQGSTVEAEKWREAARENNYDVDKGWKNANMFQSVKNIKNPVEKQSLIQLIETRTTDFFPDTGGRPIQEHFRQYVATMEENYGVLKHYTDQFGWPSQERLVSLGLTEKDALAVETAAFLCIQHLDANIIPRLKADNYAITSEEIGQQWQERLTQDKIIARQTEMLHLMKKGEATPGFCCYLTDRILRNRDEPQLYGTQGSLVHFGIKTKENLSEMVSLPDGQVKLLQDVVENEQFLSRRKENGLGWDMESLQTRDPLSFIKEIRDNFPKGAKDKSCIATLKHEIASLKDQTTSLESLSIDALDPRLKKAQATIEEIDDNTPTKSWVGKMQSTTSKGSREI